MLAGVLFQSNKKNWLLSYDVPKNATNENILN
jgi:hypothetical protein